MKASEILETHFSRFKIGQTMRFGGLCFQIHTLTYADQMFIDLFDPNLNEPVKVMFWAGEYSIYTELRHDLIWLYINFLKSEGL